MKAFTLLEMLLATALLSLLIIGVLSVMATVKFASGDPELPYVGTPTSETLDACARLLREDLAHSRNATFRDNVLELRGFLTLDPHDRHYAHRPARVQYAIEDIDGRRWLVRRQMTLDLPAYQNLQPDLVLCGVRQFLLQRIDSTPTDPAPATPNPIPGRLDAAGTWRLQVWIHDRQQPAYQRLLIRP